MKMILGIRKMKNLAMLILTLLITGCSSEASNQTISTETPAPISIADVTATPTQEPPPAYTDTPEAPADPFVDWQLYTNENFQISIKFPSTWFGPEVYEVDNEVRLAIGSDTVYPYGTDRVDQIYTVKNSYYITIQYRKNPGYSTLEEYSDAQPWLSTYMSMFNLKNGESISGPRALDIRVREVELGQFHGLEYIATLSETAQTEPFYSRQVILFDEHLNVLMVMGSPNSVEIPGDGNWREAFINVDQENQKIFEKVLEFISVE